MLKKKRFLKKKIINWKEKQLEVKIQIKVGKQQIAKVNEFINKIRIL